MNDLSIIPGPSRPLVIVGAGGHGRVVFDCFRSSGIDTVEDGSHSPQFAGFLDDVAEGPINGERVIGTFSLLHNAEFLQSHRFIVALGNQQQRRKVSNQIRDGGGRLATIIHGRAWVSPFAEVGAGTVIVGGAIVNANARIGDFCIINTAATIDNDCRLADGVQVCPGARLAGQVDCGGDVFIGTGAIIVPRMRIGAEAFIGAGSVIIDHVPARTRFRKKPVFSQGAV